VRGISMPDEASLPPGPLRDLTVELHELYRAAGRPSMRAVASEIAKNDQLRATASHETVRAVLNGRIRSWEVLEAVGRQLAVWGVPPQDPEEVALRLIRQWNHVGDLAVVRGAVAAVAAPRDEEDMEFLLREIDAVLEENPEEFVRGFVQQSGGLDEEIVDELLERYPDVAKILGGRSPGDMTINNVINIHSVFVLLYVGMFDGTVSERYRRGTADDSIRSVRSAVETGRWRSIDIERLVLELQANQDPGSVMRGHLQSRDEELFELLAELPDSELRVTQFHALIEDLVARSRTWKSRRRQSRVRDTPVQSRRWAASDVAYRGSLADRNFSAALVAFEVLAAQDSARASALREETGFAWLGDADRDVLTGFWIRAAVASPTFLTVRDIVLKIAPILLADNASPPEINHAPRESPSAPATTTAPAPANPAPERKQPTSGLPTALLKRIFTLADDRQLAPTSRRWVEFRATPAGAPEVSCHVICHLRPRQLSARSLALAVIEREPALVEDRVDYLVIVSPQDEVDPEIARMTTGWRERATFPFDVVVFGAGVDTNQPETVLAALPRRARLPGGWMRYLRNPALLTFPGEDSRELDEAFHIQLPTRLIDAEGTPLPSTAFDHVAVWLASDRPSLVVAGDFGDGKTFFTYNLARRLCADLLAGTEAHLPLRLALKDLISAGNARELLRSRLDDVGLTMADWQVITNELPTVVMLDGFDEISTDLSREHLLANIKLLRDCYRLFATSKVLVTSRSRAFGPPAEQHRLFDRIGRPDVVYLRPFERSEVLASLLATAENNDQRSLIDQLQRAHDPIGVATKPLYFAMVRDTLPELVGKSFTENLLYETYIERTLNRKLDFLEDEQFLALRSDIVENLKVILERAASELQRTNAPYLYLRDLDLRGLDDGCGRPGLARVLWRISEGVSDEDATARVGIRSLLKGHPDGVPERWPVDFCHRSMREYFAARAIATAIHADLEPPALLTQVALSAEVLRFASLVLRARAGEEAASRLADWAHAVSVDDVPSPLAANSLSLLYGYTEEVPGHNWSQLRLDRVQLAGADLSGKTFRGSSLRGADLDNVDLTRADLTDADLTGVQLEETAEVTAVAAGPGELIYAAYSDRTVRAWELGTSRAKHSVLCSLPHRVDRLWLTPCGRLVAVGDFLTLLDSSDGGWRTVSRFALKSQIRLPDFGHTRALMGEERPGGGVRLLWFDPSTDAGHAIDLPGARRWSAAGPKGYVAAEGQRIVVQVDEVATSWDAELVNAVAMRHAAPRDLLVAVGRSDGVVQLIRLVLSGTRMRREVLWTRQLHAGPVTAITFLGNDRLVTGGVDRGMCVVSTVSSAMSRFELTLRCTGVHVTGMRGNRERMFLERLSWRDHSRDEQDSAVTQ
jgi:ubiquitin-like protein Pup